MMDLAGSFDEYKRVDSPDQVGALMLCLDWMAVGDDMRSALREAISGSGDLPQKALHGSRRGAIYPSEARMISATAFGRFEAERPNDLKLRRSQ